MTCKTLEKMFKLYQNVHESIFYNIGHTLVLFKLTPVLIHLFSVVNPAIFV